MTWLALAAQAGMQLAQGYSQKAALQMQSIVAGQQAIADENVVRREGRDYRGRAAAALAENGLDATGSSGLLVDQSATINELDALNTRYKGRMRALGLESEAADAQRSGEMLAGQTLLKQGADLYRPRSRGLLPKAAAPTGYASSGFSGPR